MQGKDFSHALEMTMPVISNEVRSFSTPFSKEDTKQFRTFFQQQCHIIVISSRARNLSWTAHFHSE
jgi:hypothetical protein